MNTQRARSLNQLAMQQSLLQKAWQELEDQKMALEIQRQQHAQQMIADAGNLNAGHAQMQRLIEANNILIRKNEVYMYSIKEATLNTIKDYRKLEKILGKMLFDGGNSYGKMMGMLTGAQNKIESLEDYFTTTFRMSPEDYKAKKAVGDKDFSKN